MQNPCPHTASFLRQVLAAMACGLLLAGSVNANGLVTEQAARWLAAQLQIPADKVTVQAPDPRLRMPQCTASVRFDIPFSNANTVRARCESPQWQLFLRAQWDEAVATAAANRSPGAAAVTTPSSGGTAPSEGARASSPDAGARGPAPARRALALTRGANRGSLLSPASVELTQVPAREADSLLITDAQMLEQMEAVRDLPPGTVLRSTDLRPAVLVRQGQVVTMTVGQGTGFTVTVRLEALQDGRMGDRVTLRNTESGRTVSGVVNGFNSVKGA
ncbi:MAG: flagellar basal body P-ring formation chaperone FlgA [Burkholderiaceae bacterium]